MGGANYLLSVAHKPFSWDGWTCVDFVDGYLQAVTGRSYRVEGDRTSTLAEAVRKSRAEGGLELAVTQRLGQPIPAAYARDGDVVLFSGTEGVGDSLGVCNGASVWVLGAAGLSRLPITRGTLAWRVPPSSP